MVKLRWGLMAAALALASPVEGRWLRADTDHFIIYGDMSESEAQSYARRLERFAALMQLVVGGAASSSTPLGKVTVYTLPSVAAVQRIAGRSNIAGFYYGNAQEFLAVVPRDTSSDYVVSPDEILFHEYTHHVTLATTDEQYPSWLTEGMAEYFSTARVRPDGSMVVGAAPEQRGYTFAYTLAQMTAAELLAADSRPFDKVDQSQKYARGWLLVHYLMTNKNRAGQLDRYMALVRGGTDSLKSGEQAFGNLGKLTDELNVYMRSRRFNGVLVPAAKIGVGAVTIHALDPCAAAIMPTRYRSAVGVTEKTAPALVGPARAVAVGCPSNAYVQRVLAEVEFDAKNDAEAMAAADRAIAADPSNVMAMTYKGRVLDRQGKHADARSWYLKANQLDTNHPLPFLLYYESFGAEKAKPSPAAVNGLYRAIVLAPRDPEVRTLAIRQLIADDDRATARRVLLPLAISRDDGDPSFAKKLLDKLDSGASSQELLKEIDHLNEPEKASR